MNQKIDDFCALLEEQVKNHSIYVWGGNGETFPTLSESWIKRRERSTGKAEEALAAFNAAVAKGYKDIRAFDCSGLGYYCLKKLGLQKSDLKAKDLYSKCHKIEKKELCKGCFVFHLKNGVANHIGYVVDDDLNVIEALGRKDGVVKRAFNKGAWVAFGKPKYFTFTDAEPQPEEEPEEPQEDIKQSIAAFIANGIDGNKEEVFKALWS